MTRSEAAKICQSIKFMLDREDYSEEVEEALNMAIAALDQEPTAEYSSDVISRQAAIDALAKEMPSLTTPDGSGEFDHDIQITDEAFVDCMQIINELPSAQTKRPTGEWLEKEVFDNQDSEVIDCYQSARCSHCGKYHTTPYSYFFDNYNFCPNCGADMTGGEKE